VQFALNSDVDELRVAVTQAQLVMDVFLSQSTDAVGPNSHKERALLTYLSTSILDMSRNSSMSLDNIERLTEMVSKSLPKLSEGMESLDKDIKSTAREAKNSQQVLELQILTCLSSVKEYMLDMKKLQETAMGKTLVDRGLQIRWQMDLRRSIQYLQSCTMAQLSLLLQITTPREEGRTLLVPTSNNPLQATMIAIQVIGSGLASGLGAIIALSAQNNSNGAQSTLEKLLDSHLPSPRPLSDVSPPDSPLLQTFTDVWEIAFAQAARTLDERDKMTPKPDSSKSLSSLLRS
jgi:hypothetical protein